MLKEGVPSLCGPVWDHYHSFDFVLDDFLDDLKYATERLKGVKL
jgi:hypothetical protein